VFTDEFLRTQPTGFGTIGGGWMRPGAFVWECGSSVVGFSFGAVCELVKTYAYMEDEKKN